MTEAEALAIAVKAIVSAFVTTEKKDEPHLVKPRRRKMVRRASAVASDDGEQLPFGIGDALSGEIPVGDFTAPEVTVSELEAMFNSEIPPPGMYNKYAEDRDIPGWVA